MNYLRLLLLPLGWLYGLIVEAIKYSYRIGWQKARRFEAATIVIGNLSVGGTGKTPHVEYVVNHLGKYHPVSVLSRGYSRKTKGFRKVNINDRADQSGDEPLQIARKFPNIPVYVCEKRASAIDIIIQKQMQTQMIVLDDAMQHWPLKADCYIMLSTWEKPFFKDFPLPAGNLREFRFNYKRADIIIISKCPVDLTPTAAENYMRVIKPSSKQKVFFSHFKYGDLYLSLDPAQKIPLEHLEGRKILLVTGIANPEIMEKELIGRGCELECLRYSDHYIFSDKDWRKILNKWKEISEKFSNALFLTTEKDATRLTPFLSDEIQLYVLPVEVEIAFGKASELQRSLVEVMYKKKGYPTT